MQFRPFGDTGRMFSFLGMEVARSATSRDVLEMAARQGINLFSFDPRSNPEAEAPLINFLNASEPSFNLILRSGADGDFFTEKQLREFCGKLDRGVIDFVQLPRLKSSEDFEGLITGNRIRQLEKYRDRGWFKKIIVGADLQNETSVRDLISLLETDGGLFSGIAVKAVDETLLFNKDLLLFCQRKSIGVLIENAAQTLYRTNGEESYRGTLIGRLLDTNHATSVVLPFARPESPRKIVKTVVQYLDKESSV